MVQWFSTILDLDFFPIKMTNGGALQVLAPAPQAPTESLERLSTSAQAVATASWVKAWLKRPDFRCGFQWKINSEMIGKIDVVIIGALYYVLLLLLYIIYIYRYMCVGIEF